MLEKLFKLSENKTDVRTEVYAGLTTFIVASYIIAVNPAILSEAGLDYTAVLLATCFTAFIGTMCVAFFSNLPFVIASGMGMNAFFTYTVCQDMGYDPRVALFAVFIEGILFLGVAATRLRSIMLDGIPESFKNAISAGVGLFITFIGLQNAGLVVDGSKLVSVVSFNKDFKHSGICAVLALLGLIVTIVLYIRGVRASFILGILNTWILGMLCQLVGLYIPDPAAGFPSLYPTLALTDFTAIGHTFGSCFDIDMSGINVADFVVVVFSFLVVGLFDTMGTIIGISMSAVGHRKGERLPRSGHALIANGISTVSGSIMGASPSSILVESAAGVGAGGRTGLTAVVAGVLLLFASLFAPILSSIPSFATAPSLIMVGFLMFKNISGIDLSNEGLAEAIPAFLCVITMPLFYSIADGIAIGLISYVLIHIFTGSFRKVKPVMYLMTAVFVLKYIFL
ncbi:MAG TPA: guanine permease [Lachnospiraceae bacterium]|nr:guanine permease [Lachnospiraceae bacterium]